MTVVRYAVCDYCNSKKRQYKELIDQVEFDYPYIVGEQTPQFKEVDGWTIKASPDERDKIAVTYDFYCDECSKLDGSFDSGDRKL